MIEDVYDHEDDSLRLVATAGTAETLTVCFSSIGWDRQPEPAPEFVRIGTLNGARPGLFLMDKKRSWLNGDGLIESMGEAIERRRAETGTRRVVAMGNSMGAFSAIVLSMSVKFDAVIAFSPQYSLHPTIVPDEHRWVEHRDAVDHWRCRSVPESLSSDTDYLILHGDVEEDLVHARLFPTGDRIKHYVLPDFGHNLAHVLKQKKLLSPIVQGAIEPKPRLLSRTLASLNAAPLVATAA